MFQTKVKQSFRKAKKDFSNLQNNMNEWILSLRKNDLELLERIIRLEAKVKELEQEKARNYSFR